MIQYTLERLLKNDLIDEIVIVGHQMLLEQRLGNFIAQFEKRLFHCKPELKTFGRHDRTFPTSSPEKLNIIRLREIYQRIREQSCLQRKEARIICCLRFTVDDE